MRNPILSAFAAFSVLVCFSGPVWAGVSSGQEKEDGVLVERLLPALALAAVEEGVATLRVKRGDTEVKIQFESPARILRIPCSHKGRRSECLYELVGSSGARWLASLAPDARLIYTSEVVVTDLVLAKQ